MNKLKLAIDLLGFKVELDVVLANLPVKYLLEGKSLQWDTALSILKEFTGVVDEKYGEGTLDTLRAGTPALMVESYNLWVGIPRLARALECSGVRTVNVANRTSMPEGVGYIEVTQLPKLRLVLTSPVLLLCSSLPHTQVAISLGAELVKDGNLVYLVPKRFPVLARYLPDVQDVPAKSMIITTLVRSEELEAYKAVATVRAITKDSLKRPIPFEAYAHVFIIDVPEPLLLTLSDILAARGQILPE